MKHIGRPQGNPTVARGTKPKGRPTMTKGGKKPMPKRGGCKSCK